MNKDEIKMMCEKLDVVVDKLALGSQGRKKLAQLTDDIRQWYVADFDGLDRRYRAAWEEIIRRRIMDAEQHVPGKERQAVVMQRMRLSGRVYLKIYFGQIRAGRNFQGAMTVEQQGTAGFPQEEVVGKMVDTVAGKIGESIAASDMPVEIFWWSGPATAGDHRVDGRPREGWIATNNRGYAAHCLAGVMPLRLRPRPPSREVVNRLGEVEGEQAVGRLTFDSVTGVQRESGAVRRLPSAELPLTDGPQSWHVQKLASVPSYFG
jgi:hypothetical protein